MSRENCADCRDLHDRIAALETPPQVVLRRYKLPSEGTRGGWALVVLGSDGLFSAVSDYGNYAYIWTHPGCEFRKFVSELEPDYFHSKIMHMRQSQVWDQSTVEKNIRERLDAMVAAGKMVKRRADRAFEEAESRGIENWDALSGWAGDENLPEDFDLYEGIAATMPEPQSWAFANKVLPRLQALLRAELAAERPSQGT